jgi:hypothetical protein
MRTIAQPKIFRDFSTSDRPQTSKTDQEHERVKTPRGFHNRLGRVDQFAKPSANGRSLRIPAIAAPLSDDKIHFRDGS